MKLLKKDLLNEVRVKSSERIKLYEDEEWLVVQPLSFEASCKYGHGSSWCTSTPSNDKNYNQYNKEGILIYYINKKTDDKYGEFISFTGKQSFFDKKDNKIDDLPEFLIKIQNQIKTEVFNFLKKKKDELYSEFNNSPIIDWLNQLWSEMKNFKSVAYSRFTFYGVDKNNLVFLNDSDYHDFWIDTKIWEEILIKEPNWDSEKTKNCFKYWLDEHLNLGDYKPQYMSSGTIDEILNPNSLNENKIGSLESRYKNVFKKIYYDKWSINSPFISSTDEELNWYFIHEILNFSKNDPTNTKKYLDYMVSNFIKEFNSRINEDPVDYISDEIIYLVNSFHNNINRVNDLPENLKSNSPSDIYTYTLDDLYKISQWFDQNPSKREMKKIQKQDTVKIFEDDNVLLVKPLTKEASCYYGSGTKWCVASKKKLDDQDIYAFDSYNENGVLYFFIFKNNNYNFPKVACYKEFQYPDTFRWWDDEDVELSTLDNVIDDDNVYSDSFMLAIQEMDSDFEKEKGGI